MLFHIIISICYSLHGCIFALVYPAIHSRGSSLRHSPPCGHLLPDAPDVRTLLRSVPPPPLPAGQPPFDGEAKDAAAGHFTHPLWLYIRPEHFLACFDGTVSSQVCFAHPCGECDWNEFFCAASKKKLFFCSLLLEDCSLNFLSCTLCGKKFSLLQQHFCPEVRGLWHTTYETSFSASFSLAFASCFSVFEFQVHKHCIHASRHVNFFLSFFATCKIVSK